MSDTATNNSKVNGIKMSDTAMNENVPESQREEAANRIVDATYGALIRQQQGYYISEPEDSFGVAPDPVIVFQERYFAEHPEIRLLFSRNATLRNIRKK